MVNREKVIRTLALLYLVAIFFFVWGASAVSYKIFPWKQMAAIYEEFSDYLKFKEGLVKSIKDKIVLDHQEFPTEYDFSGFRIRDPNFHDTGFLLISRYSKIHHQVIVELFSIANNKILHTWIPPQSEIFQKSLNLGPNTRDPKTFRAQHPLLLKNGDLIFTTGEGPMVRINACGDVIWVISRHFHHSVEVDHLGNIITCIVLEGERPGTIFPIKDDGIAVVSFDGEIIKEYSVTDILLKNGYRGLVSGVGPFEEDRIHLNDAQPILKDSKDAKIGDIALSLRNLSTVALLHPESGKLKWLKTGPWLNQHDINQLEDGRYSIFGNDLVRGAEGKGDKLAEDGKSEIYLFDQINNNISRPYSDLMAREKIATPTAGRLKILENGDAYIEESDMCRLLRISENSVRWEYVNSISSDTMGAVHWSRYLPGNEVDLKWKENIICD